MCCCNVDRTGGMPIWVGQNIANTGVYSFNASSYSLSGWYYTQVIASGTVRGNSDWVFFTPCNFM